MLISKTHGREYYKRIWLFLTLFVVSIQVPFSILTYQISYQKILEAIESSNRSVLQQIQNNMEHFSEVTKNICMEIFMNNDTKLLMYTDSIDYYDGLHHMKRIQDTTLMIYPFIDSVTIYNAATGEYFCTGSANTFLASDLEEFIHSQESISSIQPILRKVTQNISGTLRTHYVFSYFMYEYNDPVQGTESYVLVNEDVDWFMENISSQTTQGGIHGDIYLSSPSGELYQSNDTSVPKAHQYLMNNYWEKQNELSEDSICTFEDSYDGKRYIVSGIHLPNQNNAVVLVQDYDIIFADINQLKDDMLYIALAFCIADLIMLLVVSKRIYSPVQEFVTSISRYSQSKENPSAYQNEFDYLKETYRSTYRQKQLLERAYQEHEPMILKYQLSQFVMDSTPEHLEGFRKHNPDHWMMKNIPICVVVFKIEDIVGSGCFKPSDVQLMSYAVENIVHETIAKDRSYSCFFLNTNQLCVLTNVKTPTSASENLMPLLKECQELIQEHLGITLSIAYSNPRDDLLLLSQSLKEAREYLEYRYVFGLGKILNYDCCRFNLSNDQRHYPYELDERLKDALYHQNLQDTYVVIDEIIHVISSYQYRSMTTCIMALVTQINMIFNDLIQQQKISSSVHFNAIYQKISQAETLERASAELKKHIASVLDVQREVEENAQDNLISTVIAFVQANYSDVNLSSQMIGDVLELSPRYIMHKFKEATGVTLNEYIINLRMSKAAALLQNTDYTISQIIQEIGIDNSTYFYRLFKKMYHCTPREFSKKDIE